VKVRRKRLLKHCKEITGCDMIVALEPENLFYMTGFWGEAIGILEKNGKTTIIAPELEVGRAKEEGVDCEVIQSDRGMSSLLTLKKFVKGKVCTDCQNYSVMQSLKKSFPLSSTTMKAGKSLTSIRHTASMPSSGYSSTSTFLILFKARIAAAPPIEPK